MSRMGLSDAVIITAIYLDIFTRDIVEGYYKRRVRVYEIDGVKRVEYPRFMPIEFFEQVKEYDKCMEMMREKITEVLGISEEDWEFKYGKGIEIHWYEKG